MHPSLLRWRWHFSHPFLGTYEVHQFLDLGYLGGTHSSMVYVTYTIPWYGGMATSYHSRVFPHTTASYTIPVVLSVNQYQTYDSTLPSPGYSMWNPWNGGWIQMDSMEWLMDSMEFPDRFHTVFRVESMWNPYGMSSWNHNSTLILTILRVESIWNEFMES